jgi:hypothetical protein
MLNNKTEILREALHGLDSISHLLFYTLQESDYVSHIQLVYPWILNLFPYLKLLLVHVIFLAYNMPELRLSWFVQDIL